MEINQYEQQVLEFLDYPNSESGKNWFIIEKKTPVQVFSFRLRPW